MPAPLSVAAVLFLLSAPPANAQARTTLDKQLRMALSREGFTGDIEASLDDQLGGRAIDMELVGLGGFLFFDTALSLHGDTSCASCHSPAFGWGDTQSIAIGVQNDGVVGSTRTGPRNLRRSPMTANTAFYPTLMWDGRFSSASRDPFDNSQGFVFPDPEGTTAFPPGDSKVTHLLAAQAFLPVTELVEMAGFTGMVDSELDDEFDVFDDGVGDDVPDADEWGYRHEPIRQAILLRLNSMDEYVGRFGRLFPAVAAGDPIDFAMVGTALAEFQFNQTAADAPIDQYARGTDNSVLTTAEKRGALIFFGKGECVSCHAVSGDSNEMFSDFLNHVTAVPQVAPEFGVDTDGVGLGNVVFDGTDRNEDFGHERTTGDSLDRYMFRTAPLRNLARSPAYFHNGAFTDLEEAIRYHLDPRGASTTYTAAAAGLAADLTKLGPVDDMLLVLDGSLDPGPTLTDTEIANLVTFVRDALLDEKSAPGKQCAAMPDHLPSHLPMDEEFQGCPTGHGHAPSTE